VLNPKGLKTERNAKTKKLMIKLIMSLIVPEAAAGYFSVRTAM
jgi:hypothetical protein